MKQIISIFLIMFLVANSFSLYLKQDYYDENLTLQQAQVNLVKDWWRDRAEQENPLFQAFIKYEYVMSLRRLREDYLRW